MIIHPPITAEEFREAYIAARLRSVGVGMMQAYLTPHIKTALHAMALEKRRNAQRETPQPTAEEA